MVLNIIYLFYPFPFIFLSSKGKQEKNFKKKTLLLKKFKY